MRALTEHLQDPEFLKGLFRARDWQDTGAWSNNAAEREPLNWYGQPERVPDGLHAQRGRLGAVRAPVDGVVLSLFLPRWHKTPAERHCHDVLEGGAGGDQINGPGERSSEGRSPFTRPFGQMIGFDLDPTFNQVLGNTRLRTLPTVTASINLMLTGSDCEEYVPKRDEMIPAINLVAEPAALAINK